MQAFPDRLEIMKVPFRCLAFREGLTVGDPSPGWAINWDDSGAAQLLVLGCSAELII